MQEIIILQGPPACGKSTFAKRYSREHPEYIVVSNDNFREMQGKYMSHDHEKYIRDLEYYAVKHALECGHSVIIDATNLDPGVVGKWSSLANDMKVKTTFMKFHIPFEAAVYADQGDDRKHKVGKDALEAFYAKYYNEGPKAEEK